MRRVALMGMVVAVVGLCLASATFGADEQQGVRFNAGVKGLYGQLSFQYPGAREYSGPLYMAGAAMSLGFPHQIKVSGQLLAGAADYNDNVGRDGIDDVMADGELLLSKGIGWVDIGLGFRYSMDIFDPDRADESRSDKYGPMVYAGAGSYFGDAPLGWYASGSWMFYDLNDDWAWGEHVNGEAGLFLGLKMVRFTVGYRGKWHYDSDNNLIYQGVTGSVSIGL